MAEHFRGRPEILRFIEFMDVGESNGWRREEVVPAQRDPRLDIGGAGRCRPISTDREGGVASRWAYEDGAGEIGVISSVSEPFCHGCTRARLSADGRLYTCLFASTGSDMRALLRDGASDEEIQARLRTDLDGTRRPLLGASRRRRGRSRQRAPPASGPAAPEAPAADRDVIHRGLTAHIGG